ncbi:MAG: hypothetical protein ACXAEU_07925 [Candidatus Hodarchaeales archaeon]|jgi:hypothetical protein
MVSSEERVGSYKPKTKSKFVFYNEHGVVLAVVKNLCDLITVMKDLDPIILHVHLSSDIRNDLFDTGLLSDLSGPVIQTDLPLWLSHALGEPTLASKILDLTLKYSHNSKILKEKVIVLCEEAEENRHKKMLEKR